MFRVLGNIFNDPRKMEYINHINSLLVKGNIREFRAELESGNFLRYQVYESFFENGSEDFLTIAVKKNDPDLVIEILRSGANPNKKDSKGMTALNLAIMNNNNEIVEILLKHKADINSTDQSGMSPLNLACLQNNIIIANLLLSNSDVNLNQKSKVKVGKKVFDFNFMECAAYSGDYDMFKFLWEKMPQKLKKDIINKNFNVLDIAITFGHNEIVDYLIPFIEIKSDSSEEFFTALCNNNIVAAKILLQNSVSPNQFFSHDTNKEHKISLLYRLINYYKSDDSVAFIDFLIKIGSDTRDFSYNDSEGNCYIYSPLSSAIYFNLKEVTKVLIENGCVLPACFDTLSLSGFFDGKKEIRELVYVSTIIDKIVNNEKITVWNYDIMDRNHDVVIKRILSNIREFDPDEMMRFFDNLSTNPFIGRDHVIYQDLTRKFNQLIDIFYNIERILIKLDEGAEIDDKIYNHSHFVIKREFISSKINQDTINELKKNLSEDDQKIFLDDVKKLLSDENIIFLNKQLRFDLIVSLQEKLDVLEYELYQVMQVDEADDETKDEERSVPPEEEIAKLYRDLEEMEEHEPLLGSSKLPESESHL